MITDTAQPGGALLARASQATDRPASLRTNRRAEFVGLATVFAQVILVALIMRAVGLDPLALRRIVYLAAAGFVVHHLLPLRLRLPFFVLLSVAGMVLVLGGTIDARAPDIARGLLRTGTILGVGGLLIGICHLPIGFWTRAGLLVAAGGALAALRANLWPSGVLAIAWPVIASMFMFRAMVYLYDLATSPRPPSPSQSVGYFFLLPNVCTLLFPVIDFRTFAQKYYDEDALAIYQRGASWMARGVLHLLLYRLVSRLFAIDGASVGSGTDLIQFIVSNMFLYLKVSGSFHLVIGLLLLFGFNLPETNHRYFLASSFTDYWRRVNIYWRYFIMKVFYYPTFFRFKRLGQVKALVIATLWSFFVTWLLHLYQTWWIKGSVQFTWPDAIFWGALGVLVLFNSLWELKRNRQRKLAGGKYTVREALGLTLRTAGTFAAISILWSLWSTPTLGQWLRLWSFADGSTLAWGAATLGCIMLATVVFEIVPSRWQRPAASRGTSYAATANFRRDALAGVVPLLAIFALTHPAVQARLEQASSPRLVDLGAAVGVLREKDSDANGQGRGYYESLTTVDQGGSQFYETMNPGRGIRYTQPTRDVEGVHFRELIPNHYFEHHDWRFTTNRWGMRDRDYTIEKPADALRLAFLGSSHVMGFGLTEAEMFEPALEARLNAEPHRAGSFEVLNFGIGGLSPLGQLWLLEARVARFKPDVVLLVAHPNDFDWTRRDVARVVRKRVPLPDGFPHDLLARAGVDNTTPEAFAIPRLRAFEAPILSFCYEEFTRRSAAAQTTPVYVFLPLPSDFPLDPKRTALQLELARAAGFIVFDLSDVYGKHAPADLMLKDQGHHLNALANALLAERLYNDLQTNPQLALAQRLQRTASSNKPSL